MEGAAENEDRNCQGRNKYLVMSTRWGSTPRLTDWLTLSRKVTLTLTLDSSVQQFQLKSDRVTQFTSEFSGGDSDRSFVEDKKTS
jgi:hypothetical protein